MGRKDEGYLDDLAPHLDSASVACLLAFLEQMEAFISDLDGYSLTRSVHGYALRVWFKEGGLVSGRGVTIELAVKSLSQSLIESGLVGMAKA
jgi:hypothetical protein